jgi:hypothetical protein
LLFAGDRRVLLTVRASAEEHAMMTTNPVELSHLAQERARAEAGRLERIRRDSGEENRTQEGGA